MVYGWFMGHVTVVFMGFISQHLLKARSCHPPHQTPRRAATATAAGGGNGGNGGNASCTAGIEGATCFVTQGLAEILACDLIYDLL